MPKSDPISEAVAAEIRAVMARRQLKQADLADVLGVSQPNVSKRLSGRTPLMAGELVVIARWLEVDPADLLPRAVAS